MALEQTNAPRRRTIGLAVSGGADSTALLIAVAEARRALDFDAVVLHVDHGLRPDSGADARFVEALAERYGLPFHRLRARIRRRPQESLEMAARRTRLAFFARMTKRLALDAIATGHHADDVAETFILRMARGSGPEGLAGLKPISHVDGITFIRPLLSLRDADLRAFLTRRGETWREDSTNTDTSILRNKVRHLILPFLREQLDPHITEHLCKSAAILRGELTRGGGNSEEQREAGGEDDGERTHAEAQRRRGKRFELRIEAATGYEARRGRIGELPAVCEMSRETLKGRTLDVRVWREGDRIAPTGLNGHSRKLQDVFVTAKVPPTIRAALPLVCDEATGEVLWVPGYRIAQTVAVESPTAPSWRFTLR